MFVTLLFRLASLGFTNFYLHSFPACIKSEYVSTVISFWIQQQNFHRTMMQKITKSLCQPMKTNLPKEKMDTCLSRDLDRDRRLLFWGSRVWASAEPTFILILIFIDK